MRKIKITLTRSELEEKYNSMLTQDLADELGITKKTLYNYLEKLDIPLKRIHQSYELIDDRETIPLNSISNPLRKLVYKFNMLPYHVRLQITEQFYVVKDNMIEDKEFFKQFFKMIGEKNYFAQLWDLVEDNSEDKSEYENPFKVVDSEDK